MRASKADERLSRSGLTHLVEHLAMPIDEVPGVDVNASVEPGWTLFWAAGPPDSVAEHLNAVAANLRKPPLARFDTERRILMTEAYGRNGPGHLAFAYMLRFGARGTGCWGTTSPDWRG